MYDVEDKLWIIPELYIPSQWCGISCQSNNMNTSCSNHWRCFKLSGKHMSLFVLNHSACDKYIAFLTVTVELFQVEFPRALRGEWKQRKQNF